MQKECNCSLSLNIKHYNTQSNVSGIKKCSDVTKLVKIRISRMRILTSKIRRMRMHYFITRNVMHGFTSIK